jgi:hypothetical protein
VRISLRSALVSASLVATTAFAAGAALAGSPVSIIVLKEHGVGTATQAQPYLDKFVATAAQQNGWDPASKGRFETTRAAADTWVKAEQPHYGIFTLAAYLALKGPYNLDLIGSAALANGGGEQYFVVSTTAGSVGECKGKRLATDHDDQRFVEKVVAAGAFKMADFTVVPTRRFGEAGHKMLNGDAECALIDDAQLADLQKSPGGSGVKTAWSSAKLPPMAMVAFPSAPAAEKAAFQQSLSKICPADQGVCTAVGLQSMKAASAADYAAAVAAYGP